MYIRLNEHRTKNYYRKIISLATKETQILKEMSPVVVIYSSIYDQLLDIYENIIKNNIVFTEDELYSRYTIGAIAVKNFDLENDEYAQKLSDSFGGTFDYFQMPEK